MLHPLDYAVNCSTLFTELPLLQRPAAAKQAGFEAVEFWWPFAEAVPADSDIDAFTSAVNDAGVRLAGLNFAAGVMPSSVRVLLSWLVCRSEFRETLAFNIRLVERL